MRIAVMGGAGDQGSVSVKDLAQQDDVEALIIADIAVDKAKALAASIGGDKVVAEKVDVFDAASLQAVLSNVDVVINTTGPFYRMGDRVAQAAIAAGVHYVDICDDPEPTVALLELHDSAAAAGVTLIIGLGCTPGATNLMAMNAANSMDKVDQIKVGWLGKIEGTPGAAVLQHGMHMLGAPLPQFVDGKVQNVEPFSGQEVMTFPSYGDIDVIYVKHPEPVTLYRYIDGVQNVTCKANAYPEEFRLDTTWRQLTEMGMTSTHPIPVKGVEISPRDFLIAMLSLSMPDVTEDEKSDETLELAVEVFGEKDGKPSKYRGYLSDTLERATGIPAAIGALMIGRGQVEKKGAFAPEGCLDPETFFTELKKRNIKVLGQDFG